MSEPHVVSALKDKRAEIAGALQVAEQHIIQLRADLATVDRAILIFDPDAKPETIRPVVRRGSRPMFRSGGWTRSVLNVLRRAEKPLPVRDIAMLVAVENGLPVDTPEQVGRLCNKTRNTLARQRAGLLAKDWEGATVVWRVAE